MKNKENPIIEAARKIIKTKYYCEGKHKKIINMQRRRLETKRYLFLNKKEKFLDSYGSGEE